MLLFMAAETGAHYECSFESSNFIKIWWLLLFVRCFKNRYDITLFQIFLFPFPHIQILKGPLSARPNLFSQNPSKHWDPTSIITIIAIWDLPHCTSSLELGTIIFALGDLYHHYTWEPLSSLPLGASIIITLGSLYHHYTWKPLSPLHLGASITIALWDLHHCTKRSSSLH